jgi:hypothetical protein
MVNFTRNQVEKSTSQLLHNRKNTPNFQKPPTPSIHHHTRFSKKLESGGKIPRKKSDIPKTKKCTD